MSVSRTKRGYKVHLSLKRKMRSEMTPDENKLWLKLRGHQFQNLKFRRQHGVGPYILDFFCAEKRLAVEVDGDVHALDIQKERDRERENYLREMGVTIIRYTNNDIFGNIDGVMEDLFRKATATLPPPAPPYKGGEWDK